MLHTIVSPLSPFLSQSVRIRWYLGRMAAIPIAQPVCDLGLTNHSISIAQCTCPDFR